MTSASPRKSRIATAVFFFVSGFGFSSWASRIPTIQQNLHLSEGKLGAVLFALPAGLMCTLPVTGYLLRRFSSRYIMFTGAVLFNIMLCLVGFTRETWQLVVVLFFFGSSRNLFNISANAQSIGVQKLYDRSIIATFHAIWSVAGFLAAALGSLLVSFSVQPSWHFLAVCILLTTLCTFFFKDSVHQQPQPHERLQKTKFRMPDKALLRLGFMCFAAMACEGTMYDWSAIYLKKAVHASKEIATAGYAFYMVAVTLGRFTGDKLANSFGVKAVLKYSGLFILTGLLLAAIFPYIVTTGLGFMMAGFGLSCVVPMVFSMAGKVKHMSGGPAIAGVSTIGYFGFLIVPPMVGFIAEAFNLRWSIAIISLLGILITWLVSEMKEE
ncbi:MFS transporter [Niastella koreensis]|uniref:Major facilitator superfamily MFS_1 n=2 Tax=Niastella koreensis TaxID=354356 RepID=G8TCV0_NIAKG|nr:MFS transporter [Niastella koreensis]AEV97159.1 major facilitator superfamily MFS_1 [Niastella koreensis GR20-10]OQP39157.1 MFS transporter [Niastella koreensis]